MFASSTTVPTVPHELAHAVETAPDQVFLDFAGTLYTYRDVDRLSTMFGHELLALGVQAGHTVATVFDNCIDQIITWLAVNKVGAVWVPLNTAYRGEFLRHQLDDSLAEVLVCDSRYLPNVLAISDGLPHLRRVLWSGKPPQFEAVDTVVVAPLDDHRGIDASPFEPSARPSDLALLVYTSGTTGRSKGCMISHRFILHQAEQSNQSIPPMPGEVMWTPLPLFHAAAIDTTLSAMISQSRIAIAERFSVSGFWAEMERSGAANIRIMASIFPLVAHAPDSAEMKHCYGQLRAVTGVPCPPALRRVWQERFGVQYISSFAYGQTEGVRLAMSSFGEDDLPEACCGRIAADAYEVVTLDSEDNVLPDGEVGEIAFRPRKPGVMFSGYWRRPEDTASVWRNLWMHTGDIGCVRDGVLFFLDRQKDYLRSRGENISSFEVERAFAVHPDVVEVAAHAIGEGMQDDCLKITAVLRSDATVTEEALCLWALDHVPHFAVPRYIEFRDDLPKTPTNKVMKVELRTEGKTAKTWDREAAGIQVRRR